MKNQHGRRLTKVQQDTKAIAAQSLATQPAACYDFQPIAKGRGCKQCHGLHQAHFAESRSRY